MKTSEKIQKRDALQDDIHKEAKRVVETLYLSDQVPCTVDSVTCIKGDKIRVWYITPTERDRKTFPQQYLDLPTPVLKAMRDSMKQAAAQKSSNGKLIDGIPPHCQDALNKGLGAMSLDATQVDDLVKALCTFQLLEAVHNSPMVAQTIRDVLDALAPIRDSGLAVRDGSPLHLTLQTLSSALKVVLHPNFDSSNVVTPNFDEFLDADIPREEAIEIGTLLMSTINALEIRNQWIPDFYPLMNEIGGSSAPMLSWELKVRLVEVLKDIKDSKQRVGLLTPGGSHYVHDYVHDYDQKHPIEYDLDYDYDRIDYDREY